MVFSDEDKVLIKKSLYLKGNTAKRLTHEFPEKAGQSVVVIKAKFHYAIWSQTGSKLVADLLARAR